MSYPKVIDEWKTLEKVLEGHSIARYGDGELKLMLGRRCVSQIASDEIKAELREIIAGKTAALVGIPTVNPKSPKHHIWEALQSKFEPFLKGKKIYYSSFITRPDSAPWLGVPEYFDKIESLWKNQRVTFVGNGVRSLTPKFLMDTGAQHVDWVECSYAHSYPQIAELYRKAREFPNERVLLCAGPTATCLAERLAWVGRHAVDLGHIGMFWRRYGQFENWQEQREINANTGEVEPNP